MIDLTNWVVAYSIDGDKDQPVGGATVSFVRASGLTQSFSPLRTDSTLNRLDDGVTYGPQLDINRAITIEYGCAAIGSVPGTYKLLFKGTIDIVDFEHSPVVATCRDQGAQTVDRKIEVPAPYGSVGGIAVETVMQSVLDATFGAGVIPLYTPSSPSYLISPAYQQQIMSVMDAQVALAQLPGFDVRYKWDDGTSAFRFTLSNPPRSKTTPDYTFGPSSYYSITKLTLDITNIRNVIIVDYPDSADNGNRHTITVSDSASITKYGRRPLIITEADTSPINTSAEATTMGNAALADLKDPKADMEIELPLFWPGDLDDLYRMSDNKVTHNTNQDLAVVQLTHSGAMTQAGMIHRSHAKVRGTPIGQYATWLARGGTIGGGAGGGRGKPPVPFIKPLNTEADQLSWDLQFYAIGGSGGLGTNLSYTVTLKKGAATVTTLDSGNASAFPRNLTVARDPRFDAVLTFAVTDAATGMIAQAIWAIPSVRGEVNAAADTFTSQVKGPSDFAIRNAGATTTFGANRHNDEFSVRDSSGTQTFGVAYDNVPQMRAIPQQVQVYKTSATGSDQRLDVRAINITASTFDPRAKLVTGGTSTPQTNLWATTLNGGTAATQTIQSNNAAVFCDLANANGVLTYYFANYDVDTTTMNPANTLFVNLYKNNGTASTSWTLVGTQVYGPGSVITGDFLYFSAAMTLDWDVRLVISYQFAPTSPQRATVVAHNVTYNVLSGATTVDATANTDDAVVYQAMEAA